MQRLPVMVMYSSHTFAAHVMNFFEELLHSIISMSTTVPNSFLHYMSSFLIVASMTDVLPLRHTSTLVGKRSRVGYSV